MTLHHTRLDTIIIGGGQAGPSLASALNAEWRTDVTRFRHRPCIVPGNWGRGATSA